ncbi:zinc finger, CCHC-type containing protein [Tanacetum coccineum]
MGDENPIRTLGDYSKPSHEGYRNTIELPIGTTWERTRLYLFQFSHRNQASNWLERLPAGSITTWEDLTTRLFTQLFTSGRTAKLRNDILNIMENLSQKHGLVSRTYYKSPSSWHRPLALSKGNRFVSRCPEYIPPPSDRARKSSPTLDGSSSCSDTTYSSEQSHYLMTLDDFDSHQEKRLSSLRTQLGQQQDDMIGKINLLWKTISEKLNDAPIPESTGNSMASENIASISHIKREELRRKGIKSPSYKESEAKEGEIMTDITPEHDHNITKEAKEEVKEVIDEEESEIETDEEVEEILEEEEEDEDGEYFNPFPTMEELTHPE